MVFSFNKHGHTIHSTLCNFFSDRLWWLAITLQFTKVFRGFQTAVTLFAASVNVSRNLFLNCFVRKSNANLKLFSNKNIFQRVNQVVLTYILIEDPKQPQNW